MKKLSVFFAIAFFAGSVSVFAQDKPKSAPKQETKKECKKGDSCCSKDKSEKSDKSAPEAKPAKKG